MTHRSLSMSHLCGEVWHFDDAQMKKGEGGVRVGEGRYQDLVCRKSLRIFLPEQIK